MPTDKARQRLRVDALGEEILLTKHSTGLQEVESTSPHGSAARTGTAL